MATELITAHSYRHGPNGCVYVYKVQRSVGGGELAPFPEQCLKPDYEHTAISEHEWCEVCGERVQVMSFMMTGVCSQVCEKARTAAQTPSPVPAPREPLEGPQNGAWGQWEAFFAGWLAGIRMYQEVPDPNDQFIKANATGDYEKWKADQ